MVDIDDICYLYKTAKDKDEQVFILADLTCSDPETIIEVLKDAELYEEKQIQQCIRCGKCISACPKDALSAGFILNSKHTEHTNDVKGTI